MTRACHGARSGAERHSEVRPMQSPSPTRITIELERKPRDRGGWTARARVRGGRDGSYSPVTVVANNFDDTDTGMAPALYEPGPCTCDEGLCDRDHEHE